MIQEWKPKQIISRGNGNILIEAENKKGNRMVLVVLPPKWNDELKKAVDAQGLTIACWEGDM